jgi:hypothetical protein
MPRSWSTNRALGCVKLQLTGISTFIIIIIILRDGQEPAHPHATVVRHNPPFFIRKRTDAHFGCLTSFVVLTHGPQACSVHFCLLAILEVAHFTLENFPRDARFLHRRTTAATTS